MSDRYYGLASSLPHLKVADDGYFQIQHLPISYETLTKRLNSLELEDYEQIKAIAEYFRALDAVMNLTNQQVCDIMAKTAAKLSHPGVKKLFTDICEVWIVFKALRQRHYGRNSTELPSVILLSNHIRRNWNHPDFSLAGKFPWIPRAKDLLEKAQFMELEQLSDQIMWRIAEQASVMDPFGFNFLFAYAIKWSILDQWRNIDREAGKARFNQLVDDVLSGV
ncbi:hypothetical protein Pse7367_2508 [Thalassoporum mexicanum PCC 7367]|uniref:DUF2764 family protein n=1 Tax=Thalassoporum mexicanum TaxID=3457544 RepID=UPI0002A0008B|nr:DUF2764 family protein [Pseudanabaena sp. PCC 7367]AFY70768.1 hypothetical protein Pse7367_2508 [Pseudanabaena sp. PCC 7367]